MWLYNLDTYSYDSGLDGLAHRWNNCLDKYGDYVEKIRAHYEQLSEFERCRIIGMKEVGVWGKSENRSSYESKRYSH
ncbi:hypothetical protein TNCV_1115351 [Trichonephila clavipes]|nr:hypothetical protein TNCV_1115351 [Trichonephila clavipes]